MGTKDKIKQKLDEAVVKSYFKPWYKRWSGRALILILILVVALFIYFGFSFFQNFAHISGGDIFNKDLGKWISAEQYQENQQLVNDLLTEDDPALGSDQPLVYIVAYQSFGCPFSKDNQADIKAMTDKFGPIISFVFKDFPTESLHENVFQAHLAASCAQEQGHFWEYHDALFANQGNHKISDLESYAGDLGLNMSQFKACLSDEKYAQEVRRDFAQGVELGVVGTPSYVVNGQLIPGAIPFDLWEQIIGFIIQQES